VCAVVTLGHRDTSLSEKGIRQAQLLSERLRHERFTHVFTSDLQRAKQVCFAVCYTNACAFSSLQVCVRVFKKPVVFMLRNLLVAYAASESELHIFPIFKHSSMNNAIK